MTGVPVLAAPAIDPGGSRLEVTLPEGLTIAEIITQALPGISRAEMGRVRVSLVTERGSVIVAPARWKVTRPKSGVRVVIRLIPGKNALKAVLQIVVAIAAISLGQFWAAGLNFAVGTLGYAVVAGAIAAGVSLHGAVVVNPLTGPALRDG